MNCLFGYSLPQKLSSTWGDRLQLKGLKPLEITHWWWLIHVDPNFVCGAYWPSNLQAAIVHMLGWANSQLPRTFGNCKHPPTGNLRLFRGRFVPLHLPSFIVMLQWRVSNSPVAHGNSTSTHFLPVHLLVRLSNPQWMLVQNGLWFHHLPEKRRWRIPKIHRLWVWPGIEGQAFLGEWRLTGGFSDGEDPHAMWGVGSPSPSIMANPNGYCNKYPFLSCKIIQQAQRPLGSLGTLGTLGTVPTPKAHGNKVSMATVTSNAGMQATCT